MTAALRADSRYWLGQGYSAASHQVEQLAHRTKDTRTKSQTTRELFHRFWIEPSCGDCFDRVFCGMDYSQDQGGLRASLLQIRLPPPTSLCPRPCTCVCKELEHEYSGLHRPLIGVPQANYRSGRDSGLIRMQGEAWQRRVSRRWRRNIRQGVDLGEGFVCEQWSGGDTDRSSITSNASSRSTLTKHHQRRLSREKRHGGPHGERRGVAAQRRVMGLEEAVQVPVDEERHGEGYTFNAYAAARALARSNRDNSGRNGAPRTKGGYEATAEEEAAHLKARMRDNALSSVSHRHLWGGALCCAQLPT